MIIIGALQVHTAQYVMRYSTIHIRLLERTGECAHKGERPFEYKMCGKSFSESGYFKRNMRGPIQEKTI